jgi:putative transposase
MPRYLLPDGVFHTCTRGVDGTPILRADDDRRLFLRLFGEVVDRNDWIVHAFSLMTNHYHLVVEAHCGELSAGSAASTASTPRRFNRRYGRKGHLFGERFWSGVIETDEQLTNACEYVLQNPVRAGLCATPDDWPWSGCRILGRWPARN